MVISHAMIDQGLRAGRRILWLAHLDLLLEQSADTAAKYGHDAHGLIKAGWTNPDALLQIGSMQSFRPKTLAKVASRFTPDLIVVDECHRASCPTYTRTLETWPAAKVLGTTGTPWRLDGQGLRSAFDALVVPTTPDQLVADGHLVPVRALAPSSPNMKGIRKCAGEFSPGQVERAMMPGLGDVATGLQRELAAGNGPALAFCATVAHSQALCDELMKRGVPAAHVDANTKTDERKALLGPGGSLETGSSMPKMRGR